MLNNALTLAALLGYLLAAVLIALRLEQNDPSSAGPRRWLALAAIAGLLHAAGLSLVISHDPAHALALVNMLSLFGWVTAVLLWLAALQRPVDNLGLILLPLVALSTLGPMLAPPQTDPSSASGWPLTVHVLSSVVGYGLLTLAAVQAVLLAYQERALRHHQTGRLLRALAPLEVMEAFLFQIIWSGFIFITISLLSGLFFVEDVFEQHLVHKTVLSIIAWAVFAVLLIGRYLRGWRGRTAMRYTLSGYVLLALAYFGARFILEVVLGRQWG